MHISENYAEQLFSNQKRFQNSDFCIVLRCEKILIAIGI